MLKITIWVIILIAMFLFVSGFSLSFKPFYFKIKDWYTGFAYILLTGAIICFQLSGYKAGKKSVVSINEMYMDEFKDTVHKAVNEILEERDNAILDPSEKIYTPKNR